MISKPVCFLVSLFLLVAPAVPVRADEAVRDVSYGPDKAQRMDVYVPEAARANGRAPVILMVHGGGWRIGDKDSRGVVKNKRAYWGARGFIFISVNYRVLPDTPVSQQLEDIAAAVTFAQAHAPEWSADAAKFILMGHSAGAHLVSLLNADPAPAVKAGAQPWRGVVSLDTAVLNVPAFMRAPHPKLYDKAFGDDPDYWRQLSPLHRLTKDAAPVLLVCSSRRKVPCPDAHVFAHRVRALGIPAEVLPQDRTHGQVNADLGEPGPYTDSVNAFIEARLAAN